MGLPRVEDGLALHQAGDLAKAQAVYREVLDQRPRDAMALHYMGVAAHQTGRTDEALRWMRESIEASPGVADFHCNLGVVLRDRGQLDAAAAALCTAIQLRPKYPEALGNLGDVLRQQGRLAEADSVLRQAVAIGPSASALLNLGLVLMDGGRFGDAAAMLRDSLRMNPSDRRTLKCLGAALLSAGRAGEADRCYRAAAAMEPGDADAWFGLGNALRLTNDLPGALEAYQRAQELSPDHPDLLINLAATLSDVGEIDAAVTVGCRAVALRPSSSQARYNLSLALLSGGRLDDGWKFYESRWNCPGYYGTLLVLPQPAWDGTDPAGKTIFLRAEQGYGDTIQFARYVPLLAERRAKIILECQAELKSLLTGLDGAAKVIARGEEPGEFDCHLPLLSLPLHFGTTLETIPNRVPYLRARSRPDTLGGGFKCGLVWRGSSLHRNDVNRSMPLELLEPLSRIEGVRFFSLQKEGAGEAAGFAGLTDLSSELRDFSDAAALLAQMDLVVTVDTAVAHLAGALGRPVWTLLPHAADWRWMRNTDRTPWYPTMRLFRRTVRGDWASVIERVTGELRIQAGLSSSGGTSGSRDAMSGGR